MSLFLLPVFYIIIWWEKCFFVGYHPGRALVRTQGFDHRLPWTRLTPGETAWARLVRRGTQSCVGWIWTWKTGYHVPVSPPCGKYEPVQLQLSSTNAPSSSSTRPSSDAFWEQPFIPNVTNANVDSGLSGESCTRGAGICGRIWTRIQQAQLPTPTTTKSGTGDTKICECFTTLLLTFHC